MKSIIAFIIASMVLLSNTTYGSVTFDDPVMVIDDPGGSCIHPSLAINTDLDRLYVAYDFIPPSSTSEVRITYSENNGSSWSTPFEVTAGLPLAINPAACAGRFNALDIVAIVFQNGNFSFPGPAYLAYSIDGGDTFCAPIQVSTSGSDEAISVDAAIRYDSSSDKYIIGVAWSSKIDGAYIGSVRYREYMIDLNGPDTFGSEIDFSTGDDHIGYASDVDLEFDGNGDPHVLFGSYRDAYTEITYSCNTGSGWSDPELINDNSDWFQQINASGRGLTIDTGDNIYASWSDMYQSPLNFFIGDVKPAGSDFGTDYDIEDCGSMGEVTGYGTVCAGGITGNVTGAWLDYRYPGAGNCFIGETTDTGANWDRPSILASPGLDPQTDYFLRYADVVRDDSENKVFILYEVAYENYIKMNVGTRSPMTALKSISISAVVSDGLINVSWEPEIETGISEYRIYRYAQDEIIDSEETLHLLMDRSLSNYDPVYNMYYLNSLSPQISWNVVEKRPDVIINVNRFAEEPGRRYETEIAGNIGDLIIVEAVTIDGQVYSFSPVTVLGNTITTGEFDFTGVSITSASPNPTNGNVSFTFTQPSAGNIEITVYDLRGQIVAEVVNGYFAEGEHSVNWESELTAGVYLYLITTAGNRIVSKLAIVN